MVRRASHSSESCCQHGHSQAAAVGCARVVNWRLLTTRWVGSQPVVRRLRDLRRADDAGDCSCEIFGKARLRQQLGEPGGHRSLALARQHRCGQCHHRNMRKCRVFSQLRQHLSTVHPDHPQLEQDDVWQRNARELDRRGAVGTGNDTEAAEMQILRVHLAGVAVIVDEQDERTVMRHDAPPAVATQAPHQLPRATECRQSSIPSSGSRMRRSAARDDAARTAAGCRAQERRRRHVG